MTIDEFSDYARQIAEQMADYHETISQYPVKPNVNPGDILGKIPTQPPEHGEKINEILNDFQNLILPGITHWQHPMFMAYFPANSSYPSILAEMLTAAMAAQCMLWDTSPAATELETRMMEWFRQLLGLPEDFEGVIQDSASSSTFAAILSAREKATGNSVNTEGYSGKQLVVYGSTQTHSSVERAVRMTGIGSANYRKLPVDGKLAMKPDALKEAIQADKAAGRIPACVVATIGTTGTLAVDPIDQIGRICREEGVWLHVDAAYLGNILVLPEFSHLSKGLELADSFVFNPHKWMLTNFDASVLFVKDPAHLVNTLSVIPEYLRTPVHGLVKNYSDWGIQLGRRFRALKIWMVLRSYGAEGIRVYLRNHLSLAGTLRQWMTSQPDFEELFPNPFNLVAFRWNPPGVTDPVQVDEMNELLMTTINRGGELYFTFTRVDGRLVLRLVPGSFHAEQEHALKATKILRKNADKILGEKK